MSCIAYITQKETICDMNFWTHTRIRTSICFHACMKTHRQHAHNVTNVLYYATHARTQIYATHFFDRSFVASFYTIVAAVCIHSACLLYVCISLFICFNWLSRSEAIILLRSFYDRPFTKTNPFFNISRICVSLSIAVACIWTLFMCISLSFVTFRSYALVSCLFRTNIAEIATDKTKNPLSFYSQEENHENWTKNYHWTAIISSKM